MDNKITLRDFWNSKKPLAIHCDTEEKANKLLEAFDKLGKEWISGLSYLAANCWETYKENTCYCNTNAYSSVDYYKSKKYKIYEFEDVIFEKETKTL